MGARWCVCVTVLRLSGDDDDDRGARMSVCSAVRFVYIFLVLLLFLPANDITWNLMICLFLECHRAQNDSKDHTILLYV